MAKADDLKDVAAVAYLMGQGTTRQMDLSERLKKSQPTISRLIEKAKERNWILTRTEVLWNNVPPALAEKARARFSLSPRVTSILQRWAAGHVRCEAAVCELSEETSSQGRKSGKETNPAFFRFAANQLAELLANSRQVGVVWGRTLAGVIDCLSVGSSKRKTPPNCIPLAGEPVYLSHLDRDVRYESTALAVHLQKRLGSSSSCETPKLTAVPAYIPLKWADQQRTAIDEFISEIPGYKAVYGSDSGLVHKIDTLLTGIGLAVKDEAQMGTFVRERVLQEDGNFTPKEMANYVLGDIAGVLIPNEGGDANESDKAREFAARYNRGLVGMCEEHLSQCAQRATQNQAPGVIVIAGKPAKKKALLIQALAKRGLFNYLIASRELAEALLKLDR